MFQEQLDCFKTKSTNSMITGSYKWNYDFNWQMSMPAQRTRKEKLFIPLMMTVRMNFGLWVHRKKGQKVNRHAEKCTRMKDLKGWIWNRTNTRVYFLFGGPENGFCEHSFSLFASSMIPRSGRIWVELSNIVVLLARKLLVVACTSGFRKLDSYW